MNMRVFFCLTIPERIRHAIKWFELNSDYYKINVIQILGKIVRQHTKNICVHLEEACCFLYGEHNTVLFQKETLSTIFCAKMLHHS
jgi:hypothetical protein